MADIAPVSVGAARMPDHSGSGEPRAAHARRDSTPRPADHVELSEHARLLSRLAQLPPIREELVQRVRQEIEQGTYETPQRLDAAIDALAEDLDLTA